MNRQARLKRKAMQRTWRELQRAERRGDPSRLEMVLLPSIGRTLSRAFGREEATYATGRCPYVPSPLGHDDIVTMIMYYADRWSSARYRRIVAHLKNRKDNRP